LNKYRNMIFFGDKQVTGIKNNVDSTEPGIKDRTEFLVLTFAVAILSLIYISLPNYRFFSDGLQFAVEMKYSPDWILHPHHVLYPLLPQIVRRYTGFGDGDLEFLAGWSRIVGILCLIGMVLLIRTSTKNLRTVIFGLILFTVTNAVWYFSVTPNQNSTALFFNIFTLLLIVNTSKLERISLSRTLAISGMIAISILGSQVNAALIFPALYVIGRNSEIPIRKNQLLVIMPISALILSGLLTVLIGIHLGHFTGIGDFISWQRSYVFQERWWSNGFFDAVSRNAKGIIGIIIGDLVHPATQVELTGSALWIIPAQVIILLFFIIELTIAGISYMKNRVRTTLQTIGLLVSVPIFVFSVFYIPENLNLRVLYVPGFMLFLLPSIERRYLEKTVSVRMVLIPALILFMLFMANLGAKYIPESHPDTNPFLVEAGEASLYISPDDIVLYPWTDRGHTQSLYLQYYIGCDALTVNKLMDIENEIPEDGFEDFLFGPDGKRAVWLQMGLLRPEDLKSDLSSKYRKGPSDEEISAFISKWFGKDVAEPVPEFDSYVLMKRLQENQ